MTDNPAVVLVHSPLVGPLTWRPVSRLLAARGYPVRVPSLVDVVTGEGPYYGTIAERIGTPLTEPSILVGHSAAGALLPVIAAAAPEPPLAVIFVDAALPHPGKSWFDAAPTQIADWVRSVAGPSGLPPWDQWFPAESIAELLPDPVLRNSFIAEQPTVPVAYFEETAPGVAPLPAGHCAYLLLSDSYRDNAEEAKRLGWRVEREPSHHLAMLTQPDRIADALIRIATSAVHR